MDYDPNGNLTLTTDEEGRTVNYLYDGLNRQVTMTSASATLNLSTSSAYFNPSSGSIAQYIVTTNPAGQVVTTTFDGPAARSRPRATLAEVVHLRYGRFRRYRQRPRDVDRQGRFRQPDPDDERVPDGAGRTVKTSTRCKTPPISLMTTTEICSRPPTPMAASRPIFTTPGTASSSSQANTGGISADDQVRV